ncbi:MAG: sugar phosphate isomerase/epimerase family protein [Gemmatimonadota bacterium]
MRYAFMTFSTPELSLAEVLAAARRCGYEGIEPRLDAGHAHGIEATASAAQRRELRQQVADSGVTLACLATSLVYADPAKTADMLEQGRQRIDLAGDLGAPALRVFGGKMGEGLTREQAIDVVAGSLRQLADQAVARGVTLCMETHDDWCDPAHVAAVMTRADHPAVAVNWDIMHPVRTGKATMDQAFTALRPWIRHLHLHDGVGTQLKMVPIGRGEIDHRRALELLAPTGYGGFLSGEWINWEPYETHLPRELAAMRGYERELGLT